MKGFYTLWVSVSLIMFASGEAKGQLVSTCSNSNFSQGNFNNWFGCYGTFFVDPVTGKSVLHPCTTIGFAQLYPVPGRRHIIMPAPGIPDPYTCNNVLTVFPGEAFSARLGDTSGGGNAEQLKYQITVNSSNYLFIYRYAVVLESPNHPATQQPGFQVDVETVDGTILDSTCGYFQFYAPPCTSPPNCPLIGGWGFCPVSGGTSGIYCYYKDWTSVSMNLSRYVGQTIQIVFTTHGCAFSAHRGYAYISAFCSYLTVQTAMCQGDTIATLTAPPGFVRYQWSNGDTTPTTIVPHPLTGDTINCILTAANGCTDTIYNSLTYTVIHTNFNFGSACATNPVQFTDSSYVNQNLVTGWIWDFGDGTPKVSGIANPTHIFVQSGAYHVKLVSNSTEGCKDSIIKTVFVDSLPIMNMPSNRKMICSDSNTNIALNASVSGSLYTWTASGSSAAMNGYSNQTIPVTGPLDQILQNTGIMLDSVTYLITPHKGDCNGPSFTYTVVVYPKPDVVFNPSAPIYCSNDLTNIQLASALPGATFAWTATGGSPNVWGYGPGSGNVIAQTLHQSGFGVETVSYHVAATINGCKGDTATIIVTVNPRPHLVTNPMNQTVCSGTSTNIILNSSCAATTYSWNSAVVTGNVSGNGNGTGSPIVQQLINNLNTQAQVNYTIHPVTGNCTGNDTIFIVFVNPKPHLTTQPLMEMECSGSVTNIVLAADIAGSTFGWTANGSSLAVSGYSGGSGPVISQTLINSGITPQSVTYHIAATVNGCTGDTVLFLVTVNPLPTATISGTISVCKNSTPPLITFTGGSSTAPYTFTYNINGGSGLTVTSTMGNNATVPAPTGVVGIFNYFLMSVQDGSLTSCSQPQSGIAMVTVNDLPTATITGTASVCQNASPLPLITFSGYNSNPPYTFTYNINGGANLTVSTVAGNTATVAVPDNAAGIFVYNLVSVQDGSSTLCFEPQTGSATITVKPVPAITNASGSTICSGVPTNIIFSSTFSGTTYTWTFGLSSGNITGATNGSGPGISQILTNIGYTIETVTYTVTPDLNGCNGPAAVFIVNVDPVADVYFNPAGQSFCQSGTTSINLLSHVPGTTFAWSATGSSLNVSGYGPGSGNLISQTLTNSGNMVEIVDYQVTPSANACGGASQHVVVTINPSPRVSFDMNCNFLITTTDARPFTLRGGLPPGGTYSGVGVNAGILYPGVAGPGNRLITYTYTNNWGCISANSQIISVITAIPFICDNILTDVQDNRQYPTIKIGTQCWLAANLNAGSQIPASAMQRDNCVMEKYCDQDIAGNCATKGGLYQWDEMMRYEDSPAVQGICPPAWHVPTENDWAILFNFFTGNGFAGFSLNTKGGSGFNANMYGSRFDNTLYIFNGFATFFWSSDSHGPYKAWGHALNTPDPSVSTYPGNRSNAFSVRCVKD